MFVFDIHGKKYTGFRLPTPPNPRPGSFHAPALPACAAKPPDTSFVLLYYKEDLSFFQSHINQAAAFVTEAVELLDDLTKQSLQAYVHEKDGGTCILQELQQEKQVVRRAVIHKALQKEAGKSQDIAMIHDLYCVLSKIVITI